MSSLGIKHHHLFPTPSSSLNMLRDLFGQARTKGLALFVHECLDPTRLPCMPSQAACFQRVISQGQLTTCAQTHMRSHSPTHMHAHMPLHTNNTPPHTRPNTPHTHTPMDAARALWRTAWGEGRGGGGASGLGGGSSTIPRATAFCTRAQQPRPRTKCVPGQLQAAAVRNMLRATCATRQRTSM